MPAAKACPEQSRRAAKEYSPQPALSLSKGRKAWDRSLRNKPRGAKEKIPDTLKEPDRALGDTPRPPILAAR